MWYHNIENWGHIWPAPHHNTGTNASEVIGAFLDSVVSRSSKVNSNRPVKAYKLRQNYPNPFNQSTVIPFSLNVPGDTELVIYNIYGQEVKKSSRKLFTTGTFYITRDGRNHAGKDVSAGVYFYTLKTADRQMTKKIVLVR